MANSEKSTRPNYFISIPVTNHEIISRVLKLQSDMVNLELTTPAQGLTDTEIFQDALIPKLKLHVTLQLLYLQGDHDIQIAQSVLQEVCEKVHAQVIQDPLQLTFKGLDDFRECVIFAKIGDKMQLKRLSDIHSLLQGAFISKGIKVNTRPFHPHLTIAKLSGSDKFKENGIKTFPLEMWSGMQSLSFGTQPVTRMELLKIGQSDTDNQEYACIGRYHFEHRNTNL